MSRKRRVLGLTCLLIAGWAEADPRWWTHDRQLTSGFAEKAAPDVTYLTGNVDVGLFVTWQQETPEDDTDVYVLASFDGCTWCGPVAWASGPQSETSPQIGAGTTHDGKMSIQVVFERGGQVFVASDASIPALQPPEALCEQFEALGPPTERRLSPSDTAVDSRPHIAVAGLAGAFSQFHATWQSRPAGGGTHILYDHDLEQDGTGWGIDVIDLTLRLGDVGGRGPDVAADLVADAESAPTIVYESFASGRIVALRSEDAGRTWPVRAIPVSPVGDVVDPVIDTTTYPWTPTEEWSGVVWRAAPINVVQLDAALRRAPGVADPDFTDDDDELSSPPPMPGDELSVSVAPAPGGVAGAHAGFAFWTGDARPNEIAHRGFVLDAARPLPRDVNVHPFAPARVAPPDAETSLTAWLTYCEWSDDWPDLFTGSCAPARPDAMSSAGEVAAADTHSFGPLPGQFVVVFADDRRGGSQIYIKQSDGSVEPPALEAPALGCEDVGVTRAELRFATLPGCPERPERYLLYHGSESEGTTPTGPFPSRLELGHDGLGATGSFSVGGLLAGETYHFALIPEDEARNLWPPDFDPRVNTNALTPAQQTSVNAPECSEVCLVGELERVSALKGVKQGDGADFVWLPDPGAAEYHLNSVTAKADIPSPESHLEPRGVAESECSSAPEPSPGCSDADAIVAEPSLRFYQVYSACGGDGAAEGPF